MRRSVGPVSRVLGLERGGFTSFFWIPVMSTRNSEKLQTSGRFDHYAGLRLFAAMTEALDRILVEDVLRLLIRVIRGADERAACDMLKPHLISTRIDFLEFFRRHIPHYGVVELARL